MALYYPFLGRSKSCIKDGNGSCLSTVSSVAIYQSTIVVERLTLAFELLE